jgi:hypothetical protein
MNIVWGALIILAVTSVAVAALLFVRRTAPEGGYFSDSDRAAGGFGVLATGFSVLLGFLIFLGFESYDTSRSGAEAEALTVAQQVQTAQILPATVSADLTGELVCYARWVVNGEWPQMEDGSIGEDLNPWGVSTFRTLQGVELGSPTEEAAYGKWLDQTSDRQQARQARIHGATGLMPTPLWIVLFFISAIIFVYLLFFADSGERAVIQGFFIGSVISVIVAMLLLLRFLDDPYRSGIGALKPVAMERSLELMDKQLAVIGQDLTIPCDAAGNPV